MDALVYQREDDKWIVQPIDRFATFDDAFQWGLNIYSNQGDAFQFAEEVLSILSGSPKLTLIEYVEDVQPGWLWVCRARISD